MQQQGEQVHSMRIPQKASRSSKMNDTYAIWKQMPRKKAMSHKHSQQDSTKGVTSTIVSSQKIQEKVKTNDVKGITLDQYFKARSQLELELQITKINQEDEQQINKYYHEEFEEQTILKDHKDIQTPEFGQLPEMKDKVGRRKSNNKQTYKTAKFKTEVCEPQQTIHKSKCKSKNKKHLPTSVDEEEEQLPMFQSFYKLNRKKQKEYEGKPKKNKMLDKVEHEKERLMEIQVSDMSFVTKHAIKFNINKNVCRQLILDELRS